MKKLIINNLTREKRFAVLDNHKMEKLIIQQPQHTSLVGNTYLGIVTKVVPGMNAAFVDIGEDKNGFIYRDKLASFVLSEDPLKQKEKQSISSYIHQGEKIIVQVDKDATGSKGPRLTGIVELSGKHVIYMPKGKYVAVSKKMRNSELREKFHQFGSAWKTDEEGIIFRTSSEKAAIEELQLELNELRYQFKQLEKVQKKKGKMMDADHFLKDIVETIKTLKEDVIIFADDRHLLEKVKNIYPEISAEVYSGKENIFSFYHLEGEIENALNRNVQLENGAYLVFDEMEALTVIDVNTGKYIGKDHLKDTVLHTNVLAAEESVRQILLRDIGGMILIDFIDMKTEEDKKVVLEKVKKELQKDERQTNIVGFTQLGILQLKRQKTKVSIAESLMDKCPHCDGNGKILSAETIAFRLERELYEYRNRDIELAVIELTEDVRDVFCGEQEVNKKELEEDILGFSIQLNIVDENKPFYHIAKLS